MKAKQKKSDERKIGLKNYLILALIFLVATAVTLYLCNVYSVYQESKLEIPVIRGTLSEITSEELEHYISENPTTILYICTASDSACRNYEKDLKKVVNSKELQNEIVYLNIVPEEATNFVRTFNEKYASRVKLTENFPALVAIEESKIIHILQQKEEQKLTISKTQQFIELHKIGE